jgi:hypothetical protein
MDDWLAMPLPPEFGAESADGPYQLVVRLYELANGEVVLTRLLGQLQRQADQLEFAPVRPAFALREQALPVAAEFGPVNGGPAIRLAGYAIDQENELLDLTLYWMAAGDIGPDLFHFVHLVNENDQIVAQHDGMPRHNTYPTSQWTAGEVVADGLNIDLSDLPAGDYTVHVGLYRLQNGQATRIPIATAAGLPNADQRLQLPETIAVGR